MKRLYFGIRQGEPVISSDDNKRDHVSMKETLESELESVRKELGPYQPIEVYEVTFKKILTGKTGE